MKPQPKTVRWFALAAVLALSACEAQVRIESKPTQVEKADQPKFKFFVVITDGGYAEASPSVEGYRLHSIHAHSEASNYTHCSRVTLVYELETPK